MDWEDLKKKVKELKMKEGYEGEGLGEGEDWEEGWDWEEEEW
jgi:hypothetical protein